MSNYPYSPRSSRDVLVKNATQGGFAIAGGVALGIFSALTSNPVMAAVIGGAMLVGGIVTRGKGSGGDKYSSLALMGLGGIAIATIIPGIGGLASWLMGAASFGLIVFGGVKLFQYFRGMKDRR